jgi:hypothetical protein
MEALGGERRYNSYSFITSAVDGSDIISYPFIDIK